MSSYVILTAARNEEKNIEKTIKAVISQSILPEKWLIISDGSIDRTDEIVSNYLHKYKFIDLIKTSGDPERNFGSKAKAVNFGYKRLKDVQYEYIGNLDADISFESTYYESILTKFQYDKKLGIAGGVRYDIYNGKMKKIIRSRNSVAGAIQLFRRDCYEDIGGYVPLKYGGIDAVAEIKARMCGWEVRSFPEYNVYHHRRTGTATKNVLNAKFRDGISNYLVGYHPIFQTFRILYRMLRKPYLIGGLFWISGYFWAAFKRYKRPVSVEFVEYLRSEQLSRLKSILFKVRRNYGF